MSDLSRRNTGRRSNPGGWTLVLVALAGVLFSIGVLGGLYGSSVMYDRFLDEEYTEKVLSVPSPKLEALRQREREALSEYKVLDPGKGVYQIPIARGMELLLKESHAVERTEPLEAVRGTEAGEGAHPETQNELPGMTH